MKVIRFGYRKDFSKVAVEKALHEMKIWFLKAELAVAREDPQVALYFKTKGIVEHDRKCLYLH